jgi:hypothetical protein
MTVQTKGWTEGFEVVKANDSLDERLGGIRIRADVWKVPVNRKSDWPSQ